MSCRSKLTYVMLSYLIHNWKLIVHLLFRTYRFGVNNRWWSEFDSMFGKPWYQRWHLIQEYKAMRFRACECYFIQKPWKLFPLYWRKKHNQKIHPIKTGDLHISRVTLRG